MKHNIIIEIDGVRHKLIKTKAEDPCKKCSLENMCKNRTSVKAIFCAFDSMSTCYRKCKPGE